MARFSNPGMTAGGMIGTAVIHGGLIAAVIAFSSGGSAGTQAPILAMTTIEASLAYKAKDDATSQPQKKPRRVVKKAPPVQPEGVSRQEDKKVERKPEPKDEPKRPAEPEEDFEKLFEKYKDMRQGDEAEDDVEVPVAGDTPAASGGQFDGSEHGFAEVSRGDPYMQSLASKVFAAWEVPTLERGSGDALGCVRLGADGRIVDTKLWESAQNANIDRSVKLALKSLQESRDKEAIPVPRHLMEATTQWTCFKFHVIPE